MSERFIKIYGNLVAFSVGLGKQPDVLSKEQLLLKYNDYKTGYVDLKSEGLILILVTGNLSTPELTMKLAWAKNENVQIILVGEESRNAKLNALAKECFNMKLLSYDNFEINPLTHEMACPHHILNDEECTQLVELSRLSLSTLPLIMHNDPQIIWRNGKKGQVVKITCPTLYAGELIEYRLIV